MSFELRHLRCFVAVAEELHFSRAAARLHCSQPMVSHAVRDLERLLGVQLLQRTTRTVALTPDGAALLGEAREILAATGRLAESAAGRREELTGTLVIGMHDEGAAELNAPILTAFARAAPEVRTVVRSLDYPTAYAALDDGRCDVVLGSIDPGERHISVHLFWDGRGVLVGPGHRFHDAAELHVADVVEERFFGLLPHERRGEAVFGPFVFADHRNGEHDHPRAGDVRDLAELAHGVMLGQGITGSSASTTRFTNIAPARYVPVVDAGPVAITAAAPGSPTRAQRRFLDVAHETAQALAAELIPTAVGAPVA